MMKCKRCGGIVYEEETYYQEDGVKMMQLGCFQCSHKVDVPLESWHSFKEKLSKKLGKV